MNIQRIHSSCLRIVFFALAVSLVACSHYDELQKNGEESSADAESHYAGQNCMSCHHDNNNEASEKWWYVAGSVYDKNDNLSRSGASIELWSGAGRTGDLIYKLQVDHSGNFYTEKIINFKGGFYPVVVSSDGKDVKVMTTKINEGACNSCHGVSTEKIEID